MGFKNFLSHLIDEDSRHPEVSPSLPPSGEVQAHASLGRVLRVLVESTSLEEDRGRTLEGLSKLAQEAEQGDSRAIGDAPQRVQEHRQVERRWVEESVRGLADSVVGVLLRLGKAAGDDRSDGKAVALKLDGLKDAVGGESLDALRREVLAAVQSISEALQRRQQRQDQEMLLISGQLQRLKGELNKVRKEATLDGLTRLANRASLDEHIASVLAIHRISGREASLLMVDVDHFKDLNDRLGHPAGDAALRALSDALARSFPRKTDFIGRYGGEEFVVVLSEDGQDVGARLAERFLSAVREIRIPWNDDEIFFTVSIGVASPAEGDEVDDWVGRADKRLYEAKRSGRDRVVGGDPLPEQPRG